MTSGNYEVETSTNIRIPVDGAGTTLAGDLYRPRTTARVPGVVTFHYGRRTLGIRCFRYFAAAGYATLVVDCRGTGESDGLPREPLDPREGQDGAAIIGWLAAQPWCTGRIGMWGFSGGAALTLLTASYRPPELKAIVPVMGFKSWERDLVHPGGIQGGIGFYMLPCIEKMLNDSLPPVRGENLRIRRKTWQEKVDTMDQWVADAWRLPPGANEWRSRDVDVTRITAATCCVGGWLDMCRETMLDTYEKITAPKKLIVGPWLHDLPENAALEPVDSLSLACAWWDQWLRQPRDNVHSESVTIHVQGSGRWARTTSWPPGPTRVATFVATSGRALVPATEDGPVNAATEPITVVTDPTVGLLSGLWTMPISDLGYPLDQHDDDQRSLSFTTTPLAEPLTIAGRGTVGLAVSPEMSACRCVVKLADVDENGRSTIITHGLLDLSSAASPAAEEVRTDLSVGLAPSCYTVAKGHRLRLVLSDSDFPRLWPAQSRATFGIRVLGASSAPGAGAHVTTLALPILDASALPTTDRPSPAPARDRGVLKFSEQPTWRISRDHHRDEAMLELSASQKRLYTSDGAPIGGRDFNATARVSKDDPASASLAVSASFHIEDPPRPAIVVRARITIDSSGGIATSEVVAGGETIAAREWRTP